VTGWLLDTNVISELVRPKPAPGVVDFVASVDNAYLSVVTLHELAYGIERTRDVARRAKLSNWFVRIGGEFSGRVIAVDKVIAERAGRLRADADAIGRPVDPLDALIAATAIEHGLRVATRDIADFGHLGVELFDPWN
jgi:hypothetical protein